MIFFAIVFIIFAVICGVIYEKRDPITRKKLRYDCGFDKAFVEPDAEFALQTELENTSSHAMRRIYVRHILDDAFEVVDKEDYKIVPVKGMSQGEEKKEIICRTFIKRKNTRELTTRLRVSRRGVYRTHKIAVDYVDGLGFHSSYCSNDTNEKIIVAPQKVDDSFLTSLITSGYGDFNAKRGFIEDAMSISTYDEYTGHEPMRQISWKKSAQSGTLMVKKFEPMGAHVTTIVFDVDGFYAAKYGSPNYGYVEYAISMLRAIFEYFEKKKISYRFYTNAKSSFITDHTYIGTPSGKKSKIQMLTMLGELDYHVKRQDRVPSAKLLDFAIKNSFRAPFVYIAPVNRSMINMQIKKLSKRKGMEVIELYANEFYKLKNRNNQDASES